MSRFEIRLLAGRGAWSSVFVGFMVLVVAACLAVLRPAVSAAEAVTAAPTAKTDRIEGRRAEYVFLMATVDPSYLKTMGWIAYSPAQETWCRTEGKEGIPLKTEPESMGNLSTATAVIRVTDLAPATEYCAEIVVENRDGTAHGGQLTFTTLGLGELAPEPEPVAYLPNEGQEFNPGQPAWLEEAGVRSVEKSVAEAEAARKAKAEQEQAAREQAAREAAEQAAESARAAGPSQCVVPSLTGHTLAGARWLLARAHCKLGHVSYPRRRHGALHIAKQNPTHGTHLAPQASISVRLIR
jgi:hypothetical protein